MVQTKEVSHCYGLTNILTPFLENHSHMHLLFKVTLLLFEVTLLYLRSRSSYLKVMLLLFEVTFFLLKVALF